MVIVVGADGGIRVLKEVLKGLAAPATGTLLWGIDGIGQHEGIAAPQDSIRFYLSFALNQSTGDVEEEILDTCNLVVVRV